MGGEHRLMDDIRLELSKHGAAVFRANVGVMRTPDGRYVNTGIPKGFSDLFGVLPNGRAFFIECKVKPNKPTPEQINFISAMQARGAYAGVAYSVEEAVQICGLRKK